MGLGARTLHEAGNWLVIADCSNVFNTPNRTAVLAEAANCVPALKPLVAKYYGTRQADVFFGRSPGRLGRLLSPTESSREALWGSQIMSGVAPGTEAFSRGVRGRRGGSLCLHGSHPSRSYIGVTANTIRINTFSSASNCRRHGHRGQPRQDRGTTTERARPDGGKVFSPRKRRRLHC